ncbi:hypothetical protein LBMAG53_08350 [Planctomycetota bacterium]|nr:hypothetical protein LBMAG53_08350 [Planctomycetota bacterium]
MLNPDYRDMLSLLIKNHVDFMIIGAYALAYHGFPRATGDIDLFVASDLLNSRRICKALVEFGAPVASLDDAYFATKGNYFQVGVAPCRIDILNEIDGIEFATTRRVEAEIDGLKVRVIAKEDFIKNKRAIGRHKDLADVECLENAKDRPAG